jgi:hypothetical protein
MAVVQAAGTDVWATVRQTVAGLMGRGDARREEAELNQLDQMQAVLATGDDLAVHRGRWEAVWQARLEVLLESLDSQGRATVAAQLAEVIAQAQSVRGGVHAAPGGVAAGGDLRIAAENGSVAGAVVRVEGGVHVTGPFPPAQRPRS